MSSTNKKSIKKGQWLLANCFKNYILGKTQWRQQYYWPQTPSTIPQQSPNCKHITFQTSKEIIKNHQKDRYDMFTVNCAEDVRLVWCVSFLLSTGSGLVSGVGNSWQKCNTLLFIFTTNTIPCISCWLVHLLLLLVHPKCQRSKPSTFQLWIYRKLQQIDKTLRLIGSKTCAFDWQVCIYFWFFLKTSGHFRTHFNSKCHGNTWL